MLSGLCFRLSFVFSINSLILSGFLLTSFYLADASLSAFSWFYGLVCANVQKYIQMYIYIYIYLYIHTFLVLILQSTCFICTTWKRKQTNGTMTSPCMWANEIKTKTKPSTSRSNWPRVILFDLVHKQCNDIILVNNILIFGSIWCLVMMQPNFLQ